MDSNYEALNSTKPEQDIAALFQCWPGGPIVSNPKECPERDTWRNKSLPEGFPSLSITGLTDSLSSQESETVSAKGCDVSDWRCLEKVYKPRVST